MIIHLALSLMKKKKCSLYFALCLGQPQAFQLMVIPTFFIFIFFFVLLNKYVSNLFIFRINPQFSLFQLKSVLVVDISFAWCGTTVFTILIVDLVVLCFHLIKRLSLLLVGNFSSYYGSWRPLTQFFEDLLWQMNGNSKNATLLARVRISFKKYVVLSIQFYGYDYAILRAE